jgi:hypothetical protein
MLLNLSKQILDEVDMAVREQRVTRAPGHRAQSEPLSPSRTTALHAHAAERHVLGGERKVPRLGLLFTATSCALR